MTNVKKKFHSRYTITYST